MSQCDKIEGYPLLGAYPSIRQLGERNWSKKSPTSDQFDGCLSVCSLLKVEYINYLLLHRMRVWMAHALIMLLGHTLSL
jgi:hypothetical protein